MNNIDKKFFNNHRGVKKIYLNNNKKNSTEIATMILDNIIKKTIEDETVTVIDQSNINIINVKKLFDKAIA